MKNFCIAMMRIILLAGACVAHGAEKRDLLPQIIQEDPDTIVFASGDHGDLHSHPYLVLKKGLLVDQDVSTVVCSIDSQFKTIKEAVSSLWNIWPVMPSLPEFSQTGDLSKEVIQYTEILDSSQKWGRRKLMPDTYVPAQALPDTHILPMGQAAFFRLVPPGMPKEPVYYAFPITKTNGSLNLDIKEIIWAVMPPEESPLITSTYENILNTFVSALYHYGTGCIAFPVTYHTEKSIQLVINSIFDCFKKHPGSSVFLMYFVFTDEQVITAAPLYKKIIEERIARDYYRTRIFPLTIPQDTFKKLAYDLELLSTKIV